MSRFSWVLSQSSLLGAGLLGLAGTLHAQATPAAAPVPALGLIVQLKPGSDAEPIDNGPWAASRERAQARWERGTQQGRQRLERLAREVGLNGVSGAGEAGGVPLLRFTQPLRGEALEQAMRRVRLHPDVAWVEPNVLVPRRQAADVVPNDPWFAQQWHLQTPGTGNLAALKLPGAWARQSGAGSGVVVAVVDSGVRFDHPDLAGRLLPGHDLVSDLDIANDGDGRDADPSDPGDWVTEAESKTPLFQSCDVAPSSWHGLFIAGQIAAATNNGQGVAGLNWGAQILPVRVAGKCGALVSDLLDGVRWAAGLPVAGVPANPNPARIINLSFGGDAPCSAAYQQTIDEATAAGALLVVAAGNESKPLARPADCARVMAVGAVRRDGAKAAYANLGPQVALSAPGGSTEAGTANLLLSTDNGGTQGPLQNTYGRKQGTSFSAPQAAGVASLMLAVNPALTPSQLIATMKAAVRPHAVVAGLPQCDSSHTTVCNCTTSTCGAGLLDADRAVQMASGPAVIIAAPASVAPGSAVLLDGRQSVALPGSAIVGHRWSQLSGPTAVLATPDAASTTVTLGQPGEHVFRLRLTDDQGRTGEDSVTVNVAAPEGQAGGGGALGLGAGLALAVWLTGTARRRRASRSA